MNDNYYRTLCEKILDHFKDNIYLTRAEFWRIYEGEAQNQSRRDLAEIFGGELDIDHTDLVPPI